MSNKPSLLIVEDHRLFSEGLKVALANTGLFSDIRQATNGVDACQQVKDAVPDLVLMDILMPDMSGVEASKKIKADHPAVKIIMLTSLNDRAAVKDAFGAGADGYCLKDISLKQLAAVIPTILQGSLWLDPKIARHVLETFVGDVVAPEQLSDSAPRAAVVPPLPVPQSAETFVKPTPPTTPVAPPLNIAKATAPEVENVLNAREVQILQCISDYQSNVEIAENLGLNDEWVDGYVRNILHKLSVTNEVQAVQLAVEQGVIGKSRLLGTQDKD